MYQIASVSWTINIPKAAAEAETTAEATIFPGKHHTPATSRPSPDIPSFDINAIVPISLSHAN